jgi:hypothetical protein
MVQPPNRLCDETHVGELQVIDRRGEVAGIVRGVDAAGHRVRGGEAAMRESHAGVVRREVRDLLRPAKMVAAQSVGKEKGRAAARHLVVEVAEGAFQPVGGAA